MPDRQRRQADRKASREVGIQHGGSNTGTLPNREMDQWAGRWARKQTGNEPGMEATRTRQVISCSVILFIYLLRTD